MAQIYKIFESSDINTTKVPLHERVPITGTISSGTYADGNIKNYSHGMFQSVYDYPYLSSSANHIFDLTIGYSNNSPLSAAYGGVTAQRAKKIQVYNQFSRVLVEPSISGTVQDFDTDGNMSAGGTKMQECIFVPFSRLLVKDEIKKGSVELSFITGSTYDVEKSPVVAKVLYDAGAATSFKVNSPAGEYGLLYSNSAGTGPALGHVYYQAGVAVLTASVFSTGNFGFIDRQSYLVNDTFVSGNISGACDAFRHRIYNLQFNNTTELNSTIYSSRVASNDFNYSANPTYLSSSQIRVKNNRTDAPISYITTIGLYSADEQLLAVAKLSEPIKKDPTQELTFQVRLDY